MAADVNLGRVALGETPYPGALPARISHFPIKLAAMAIYFHGGAFMCVATDKQRVKGSSNVKIPIVTNAKPVSPRKESLESAIERYHSTRESNGKSF